MNDNHIKQGLSDMREVTARTPECPDPHQISAFADGTLDEPERMKLAPHISNCPYCIEQVADLSRIRSLASGDPVPDLALARAKRMGRPTQSSRQAICWATAAGLVLAVGITINLSNESRERLEQESGVIPPASDFNVARIIDAQIVRPRILSPAPEMALPPGEPKIEWTPVSGSLYYDVHVISEAGNHIWKERVTGANWVAVEMQSLAPGTEYFVRIDAYLPNAKTVSSEHVAFTVGEQ
jgi:hypothetical protein